MSQLQAQTTQEKKERARWVDLATVWGKVRMGGGGVGPALSLRVHK